MKLLRKFAICIYGDERKNLHNLTIIKEKFVIYFIIISVTYIEIFTIPYSNFFIKSSFI